MNHLMTIMRESALSNDGKKMLIKVSRLHWMLHWTTRAFLIVKCREHVHHACNSNDKLCYPQHILNTFHLTFYTEDTLYDFNSQLN